MKELTLEWQEEGQHRTQKIYDRQPSINPGTVRIGRDPEQCDIVLTQKERTVSRLHVEIFFNQQQNSFYLRNLKANNPPVVDGQQLIQGEVRLHQGSTIYLGQMEVKVVAVSLGVPETVIVQHQLHKRVNQPVPPPPGSVRSSMPTRPTGVQCANPKCGRIWPEAMRNSICAACGWSLNAGQSVLMTPSSNQV